MTTLRRIAGRVADEIRRACEWLALPRETNVYGPGGTDFTPYEYTFDDEPIRGRVWDAEDVDDLFGVDIDSGWPGEDE